MMCFSDITINDNDPEMLRFDIGERLSIFRELVGATPDQLAGQLNKKTSHIKAIENGEKFTDCADLIYLEKKYGLNPNWLTSGKGNMFDHLGPCTPASAFSAGNTVHYKNPNLLKWVDFFNVIAVPIVSEELFHKLKIAKRIFSNEIKLFQYQNTIGSIMKQVSREGTRRHLQCGKKAKRIR
jgi:transcriptional regulator with XRE-family HTH domain